MNQDSKIFLAGHNGLVGSAILRKFNQLGYKNIITASSKELDLTNQAMVNEFFKNNNPEYVIISAAKVGGIYANSAYPADFIYINSMIAINIIHASYEYGVKKLLNLGSSCIYPKLAQQPLKEECLLTGALEETNEAYAIAKILAIKMCQFYNKSYSTNFISAMPTNQYGEGDNFNMETAHVLPMILRRFHLAKLLEENNFEAIKKDLQKYKLGWNIDESINYNDNNSIQEALSKVGSYRDKVVMWGDGSVYREFMISEDLADACLFLMNNIDSNKIESHINITSGTDIQLKEVFNIVKSIVGFNGIIEYDATKPNGTPRKLMDNSKIQRLGWEPKIQLEQGILNFYNWYKKI